MTFFRERKEKLIQFYEENSIYLHYFRYEIYGGTIIIVGVILSVIAGIISDSWARFPSTISALNCDFNDASGRLFFGSMLCGGICLIKSSNQERHDFFSSISSMTYVSLIVIGVVPYRSFDSSADQLLLLVIHLFSSGILVFIGPSAKLFQLWQYQGIRTWSDLRSSSTRQQSRVAVLFSSQVLFLVFIILQATIVFSDLETLERNRTTVTFINDQGETVTVTTTTGSGSTYINKTYLSSFIIECTCVLLVFIELVLSFPYIRSIKTDDSINISKNNSTPNNSSTNNTPTITSIQNTNGGIESLSQSNTTIQS